MTAPDLKPCPFCGGIAYLRDDVSHSTAYFIGCATEDCFGEIHWGQNKAEAVTGWNTRPTQLAEALAVPTDAQVASACLSYRHDFGLLDAKERALLMFQAREWLHAWRKELPALRAIGEGNL